MRKPTYEDNVCSWLTRKGLAPKYEHAGIYCIQIDSTIVYIGKSRNMLRRVAQHYVGIQTQKEKKYRILAEAQRKGHAITFDVLYDARATSAADIENEIGAKEGEYIRKYQPALNFQFPKEEEWRKFQTKEVNAREVLSAIL